MLLLACACPSFEEMEVVDNAGSADAAADAALAIAYFALWTGDPGVCVPEVRIEEDLREPAWVDEDYRIEGGYRGPRRAIDIAVDASEGVYVTTVHELCHAVDVLEAHSDTNGDLFPDQEVSEALPEERRDSEDFAVACEDGPEDTTLDDAIADACGEEPYWSDADRYLADVVFPAAPRMALHDEPLSLTVTERAWTPGVGIAMVYDAVAADGAVALVIYEWTWEHKGAGAELARWIYRYDPTLTRVLSKTPVPGEGSAYFVRADTGLYVAASGAYFEITGPFSRRLDVPYNAGWQAISEGVLYAGGVDDSIRAWTLDGEELAIELPFETWGRTLRPYELWPITGGVGFLAPEGLGTYELATGAWTKEPAPLYADDWAELSDGRGLVPRSLWDAPIVWDDGEWWFAGDPCDDDRAWTFAHVVVVDDRVIAIGDTSIFEVSVGEP